MIENHISIGNPRDDRVDIMQWRNVPLLIINDLKYRRRGEKGIMVTVDFDIITDIDYGDSEVEIVGVDCADWRAFVLAGYSYDDIVKKVTDNFA